MKSHDVLSGATSEMTVKPSKDPASIQYMGVGGSSADCKEAVVRLIQFGDRLQHARVLTNGGAHSLLLTTAIGDVIAIKSGFASGYGGEGPAAFSFVLALLEAHGVEVDEVDVTHQVFERLDTSSLTMQDLDIVKDRPCAAPRRISDYVTDHDWEGARTGEAWVEFPPVVPYAIIDVRIADLARHFWDDADRNLLTAWRRLEDTVRTRIGSREHSARLFSIAFLNDKSVLWWPDIDSGEQTGRANMFVGAYAAYRNPRAHRELGHDSSAQLCELLVINQLYCWERGAIPRQADIPE